MINLKESKWTLDDEKNLISELTDGQFKRSNETSTQARIRHMRNGYRAAQCIKHYYGQIDEFAEIYVKNKILIEDLKKHLSLAEKAIESFGNAMVVIIGDEGSRMASKSMTHAANALNAGGDALIKIRLFKQSIEGEDKP